VEHGVKFAPLTMVIEDLVERNAGGLRGITEAAARTKLERILREEEEWQAMLMYRRDKRFSVTVSDQPHTLELERTILDMLHCPMRMHEKVLNVMYGEILNGKTKNEVNGTKRRFVKKVPLGVAAEGQQVAKCFRSVDGLEEVFKGVITGFRQEKNGGLYTVLYVDGDREDFNYEEYVEARNLATALDADVRKAEEREHAAALKL
jgi:hypothetical protein